MSDDKRGITQELRIPLMIDFALLAIIIFQAGALYGKVLEIERQVQDLRTTTTLNPVTEARVVRIEGKVENVRDKQTVFQAQINDIQKQQNKILQELVKLNENLDHYKEK